MIIDYKQLELFWNWLRFKYPKSAFTEIKLMGFQDPIIYTHVKEFSTLHPHIIIRKNTQFFIKDFNDLKLILEYKDNLFCKETKVCYSISPKFMINNDISGGYKNMVKVDILFLDIEKVNHSSLNVSDTKRLDTFTHNIIDRLEEYGLSRYIKVNSGAGTHLLYKLKSKIFDDKRKQGYKDLINHLENEFNTEEFIIDHCLDLSRCIGLPETMNIKRDKQVKIISSIPDPCINNFYIKSTKKKRVSKSGPVLNVPEVKESLEWKIITHPDKPIGQIHNYVLFSLKLLLKAKGYTMEKDKDLLNELEDEINDIDNSNHILDLNIGIEDKEWNEFIIKRWCQFNNDWCEKNGINWKTTTLNTN